jgi:hypothetical protein
MVSIGLFSFIAYVFPKHLLSRYSEAFGMSLLLCSNSIVKLLNTKTDATWKLLLYLCYHLSILQWDGNRHMLFVTLLMVPLLRVTAVERDLVKK